MIPSNVDRAVGTSGQRLFCDNQTVGIITIAIEDDLRRRFIKNNHINNLRVAAWRFL
jgi:hypothetical protein